MKFTNLTKSAWSAHLHKMRMKAYNDPIMRGRMTKDGIRAWVGIKYFL